MSKIELANKLNKIMWKFDTYEYQDSEYSFGQAFDDIMTDPFSVISGLLDIIDNLTD